MSKISILTPVLADTPERVEWLGECLDSVLAQEFGDWEHIIVDDASPLDISPAYRDDDRFRWYRVEQRSGPSLCRNVAASHARSSALLALDSDDLLMPHALQALWEPWSRDRGSIVYGDMVRFTSGGEDIITFKDIREMEEILNLDGAIPVTALHSIETYRNAGGWKARFDAALEDIDYWICAVAAGHCGRRTTSNLVQRDIERGGKIVSTYPILRYRKHDGQRTMRAAGGGRMGDMRKAIREAHKDLYDGRYPMGCCGGGRASKVAPTRRPTAATMPRAMTLPPSVTQGAKIGVQYVGTRDGTFGVKSKVADLTYWIEGTGSVFEIYAADAGIFQRAGRGKDFVVGVPMPSQEPEPEPVPQPAEKFQAPPPQLTQASEVVVHKPEPSYQSSSSGLAELDQDIEAARGFSLADIETLESKTHIREALEDDGWTVEQLARSLPESLTQYKGVGKVTSQRIVEEAQDLWSS